MCDAARGDAERAESRASKTSKDEQVVERSEAPRPCLRALLDLGSRLIYRARRTLSNHQQLSSGPPAHRRPQQRQFTKPSSSARPSAMFSTRLHSSTSNSAAFEQSNADLTLLAQSLSKSKRITDQMTSRLGDFDDRLARLEKVSFADCTGAAEEGYLNADLLFCSTPESGPDSPSNGEADTRLQE